MLVQIAAALKAEKLILMTDVPGVLEDKDDVNTKYNELNIRGVKELITQGIIAGGMIPKYAHACCLTNLCRMGKVKMPVTWEHARI